MDTTKSAELEAIGRKAIPGAMMSNWRKDEGYHPVYITRGEGSRLWDVDGNEYIDYSLSMGPAILGHSNSYLREALSRQAAEGLYSNEVNELQIKAAQKVKDHVACAELVRFANSGTEANLNALRVARAFTGRNMFVRFNGHYNGSADNLIGGLVINEANPIPKAAARDDDMLSVIADTAGRARRAFDDCYMLEWNDLAALEKLFASSGDDIAAVIMEPVMVNFSGCLPEPDYLEGVRKLCDDYGVVLIFDEVLTGFRMGLKSAQGHFGVTPDLTTMGKAIGGGFPVSMFCGKRELMDELTTARVAAGGTYNGHPLAMTAVVATIEELEREHGAVYERIDRLGIRLKEGLEEIARRVGQNLLLQGFPASWTFTFSDKKKIINHLDSLQAGDRLPKAAEFGGLLKERGVLTLFRFCTSAAHTETDVDECLERAEDALRQLDT